MATFSADYPTQQINVLTGDNFTIQELLNFIRDQEDNELGISEKKIADAFGKTDLGGGVSTGITLILQDSWKVKWFSGVLTATTKGGNLVRHDGTSPITNTGGADTIIIVNSEAATVVAVGSGVTDGDKEDIVDRVWDELLAPHVGAGSSGKKLTDLQLAIENVVWDEPLAGHTTVGSTGKELRDIHTIETGRWKIVSNQLILYDTDEATPLVTFDLKASAGDPTETNVFERDPV